MNYTLNRFRRIALTGALLVLGLVAAVGSAFAQAYPAKPVRIVVPFGTGAGGDTSIRLLAQHLSQAMGQQFIVDNKPGGNGVIGAQEALRAPADGYTLFYGSTTTLAANKSLMKSIPYDPVADFAPISRVGVLPFLLVISSGHSISSVKELIAYAKANPGKLSYASANATGHVAGAMFAQMAGIDMLHVPFKTTANAMTNVLNGEVSIMFMDIPPALGQISAEKLRPLGVTTARRTSLLPQVPSIAEAPLPGFELIAWTALCAPAGTSSQIVNRLNVEIVKVLADPEVKKILAKIGIEAVSSTPEEASAYIRAERERWAQLVRTAGIQPE